MSIDKHEEIRRNNIGIIRWGMLKSIMHGITGFFIAWFWISDSMNIPIDPNTNLEMVAVQEVMFLLTIILIWAFGISHIIDWVAYKITGIEKPKTKFDDFDI